MIQFTKYKEGEIVILDKDYNNGSEVSVVRQSNPNRIYTTVRDDLGNEWDVMTNRLNKKL